MKKKFEPLAGVVHAPGETKGSTLCGPPLVKTGPNHTIAPQGAAFTCNDCERAETAPDLEKNRAAMKKAREARKKERLEAVAPRRIHTGPARRTPWPGNVRRHAGPVGEPFSRAPDHGKLSEELRVISAQRAQRKARRR